MIDRKINVEKLGDEQLEKAEKLISDTINKQIDAMVNRWNPVFATQGLICKMQVSIQQESSSFVITDKRIDETTVKSREMQTQILKELNEAIIGCNKLLTRYSLACDMALITEPLTAQ